MTLKTRPQAGDESTSRKIVVSIDFGTTWSGAAWAQSARPEIQSIIVQWSDSSGSLEAETSDKVPTEIAFDDNGNPVWGFSIPENMPRYMWFKLGLDPLALEEVSHLSLEYPEPRSLPLDADKTAIELVTEYLACTEKHVYSILKLKLGQGILDTTPIEYVLTCPAMWSDAAKDRTAACAAQAGMGDVQLISEPEAAVVYALDAMDPHNLQVGDTFVLCDAGGGTVDLISYTIEQFSPKVKVTEAVPGDGDACGSTFLNRIFGKWLEDTFGEDDEFDDEVKEMAMTAFEKSAKRKFTGDDQIVVPVVGMSNDSSRGIKRGRLSIPATTVKTLFRPVISTITALVKKQIKQTKGVKAVLLVGGFGQSPYLRNCLAKVVSPKIEVMQPTNGWTAVVRGALIHGLNIATPEASRISIGSRKARKFYGVRCTVAFDPVVHRGRARSWDAYTGLWRVEEMYWLVKKGDTISEDAAVASDWYRTKEASSYSFLDYSDRIYVFDSKVDKPAPRYPCSEIRKLVDLNADVPSIPLSSIPIRHGQDGVAYNVLDYQIQVNFFSAHTEYSLWHKGKEYGKVKAEYA